ncbi:fimbrial protein [Rahnella sp. SL6]|uniref:fimbrial protein n=1 Tax=Rahnella perminowiae TaxID=2816244 RepID=UPI001C275DFD|nr:fimbrial protein [Rahnella perminowiae]MBU9808809.1 fimbrial protein [Rahnella perminowiae]
MLQPGTTRKPVTKMSLLLTKTGIFFLFFFPVLSHAQCTSTEQARELTFTPGHIVIPHNRPAGYVLYEQVLTDPSSGGASKILNCQGGGKISARINLGNLLKNNIYSTNIPGVGYRLSLTEHPFPWDLDLKCNNTICQRDIPVNTQYKLELIKTNDRKTTAGVLSAGRYAKLMTDGGSDITHINIGSTLIAPSACTLSDENIHVDLGRFDVKDFKGPGSSVGERNFRIDLNCDAQMQYSIVFDGIEPEAKPSNGLIALDKIPGSAEGISLRIKHNSQPVELRKDIPFTSDVMGTTSLLFSVEYYQIMDNVVAGKANGKATFNIRYD